MPSIDVFVTSILSNPQLRGRHERVRRALASVRVPYAEHDVAGDETAKSLWKRKNCGKNELPFILVDGDPVGNIDELDEAVEFGELRQFLRLDSPPPPPPVAPNPTPSDPNPLPVPPSTVTTRTPPPPPKPSLDDFADLDLSEAELAALAREISAGETFSSGLGSASSQLDAGFDFSHATRRFDGGATAPLRMAKVNFARALPDRPLASDVARDELEGIDQGELDLDELERFAKELEADELERRRLRDAQAGAGARGVDPPPLPEKELTPSPPVPEKSEGQEEEDKGVRESSSPSSLPKDVAESTSVEGMGGASLSAPLAEVEQLRISTVSPSDVATRTLTLESPVQEESAPSPKFADPPASLPDRAATPPPAPSTAKSLFSSVADVFTPSSPSSVSTAAGREPERKKSTPTEVEHLKKSLEGDAHGAGGGVAESDMPNFGVKDMDPAGPRDSDARNVTTGEHETKGDATLEDRVAQAIREGDL
ncbi:hypothetical protein JCM11491_000795 [Sporobolomyces phaffii]